MLEKPEINLQITEDTIYFENKTWPISSTMILDNAELETIRAKAILFKKGLEALLKDQEGYF